MCDLTLLQPARATTELLHAFDVRIVRKACVYDKGVSSFCHAYLVILKDFISCMQRIINMKCFLVLFLLFH